MQKPLGQYKTINVAVTLKLIAKKHLPAVIVDSTIAHKAIAYPTDSKMLETARLNLAVLQNPLRPA